MVGMIQILTYLLCVYLVFKAVEIFQIALMSPRDRTAGLIIGALAIIVAVAAAIGFATWIDGQAARVGSLSLSRDSLHPLSVGKAGLIACEVQSPLRRAWGEARNGKEVGGTVRGVKVAQPGSAGRDLLGRRVGDAPLIACQMRAERA